MGIFEYTSNGKVKINDRHFDLEIFKILFPDFQVSSDTRKIVYIQDECRFVITQNGQVDLPIPWEEGDSYIKNINNLIYAEEQDKIDSEECQKEVEKLKKENLSYREKRKGEYPPVEELVVALWEHLVENKSKKDSIDIVQEKRLLVKKKFPK
tara:strand:+ start:32 stop:490 length:459 start_codon:yes stop_codon:yes gene_type:complete